MENKKEGADRTTAIIRWAARAIGTIVVLFWLLIAVGYGITEPSQMTLDDMIMVVLVAGTTLGLTLSWINEKTGGIITLLFGLAHSTYALVEAGHNQGLAMLISGGPFILVGILFLIAFRRSSKQDISESTA